MKNTHTHTSVGAHPREDLATGFQSDGRCRNPGLAVAHDPVDASLLYVLLLIALCTLPGFAA